jgi:hypothetical protein
MRAMGKDDVTNSKTFLWEMLKIRHRDEALTNSRSQGDRKHI